MKIAIIHFNLGTEAGDPRVVLSLGRALSRAHHKVVIYAAEFNPKCFPELHKGLEIRVVPPCVPLASVTGAQGIVAKIKERLRRNRLYADIAERIAGALDKDFDVVDCHNDASYQIGIRYKKANPRARVVWTMLNPPFYHARKEQFFVNLLSSLAARWEKMKVHRYLSGIDAIVTLDEERKRMIESIGKPVFMLRIPVDFESFYAPPKEIAPRGKTIVLLGVGALSPFRKFEDIILAGAALRRKRYDARVILVCKDFWKENEYRSFLIKTAEDSGMGKFVDFRFGGASEAELRDAQRKSDIFIFPNTVNIWGMAAFEAMAAGLPLVVSRVTSVAEALKDGVNALFTDPGEPKHIATQIAALLRDPRTYGRIAKAGQEFVKNNLNWERYAEKFIRAASPAPIDLPHGH